uniref:Ubiquinone biosynthesis protein n=1 Tax=Aegilops tauschii TaxID=37682 RepID=M8AZT6_AEGTA
MASFLVARRLLCPASARRLLPCTSPPPSAPAALCWLSTDASPSPPLPVPPLEPTVDPPKKDGASFSAGSGAGGAYRTGQGAASGGRRSGGAGYEEEQQKPRMGWSESAMIAGARDVAMSPAIVGAFPRKEAALVEFFMDDCLQQLMDRIDAGEGELLKNLMLTERLSRLVRMRLEMQTPYISKWPQALSIQSQPANVSTSLKQRAVLVDEIWHAAGDAGSDIDWQEINSSPDKKKANKSQRSSHGGAPCLCGFGVVVIGETDSQYWGARRRAWWLPHGEYLSDPDGRQDSRPKLRHTGDAADAVGSLVTHGEASALEPCHLDGWRHPIDVKTFS